MLYFVAIACKSGVYRLPLILTLSLYSLFVLRSFVCSVFLLCYLPLKRASRVWALAPVTLSGLAR